MLYLYPDIANPQSSSFVRYEEDETVYIKRAIDNAKDKKEKASAFFSAEKFEEAADGYMESLQAMRYLGDGLSNEYRAEVVELVS